MRNSVSPSDAEVKETLDWSFNGLMLFYSFSF